MDLNRRLIPSVEQLDRLADDGTIEYHELDNGAIVYDFGIDASGGIVAGEWLATFIMANLARVQSIVGSEGMIDVQVRTDYPLEACIGSQYAGWPVQVDSFFAMGSGPMRAARGEEPVLREYDLICPTSTVLGALETDTMPDCAVTEEIARQCDVEPGSVILLVAPVTSVAGSLQVVARSIETALHKLHEIGFDLRTIRSAIGSAPLPPPAIDTIGGIGRTNDAILYAGDVTLWVDDADAKIEQLGPQVPSSGSSMYGESFVEIFRAHDNDFYQIDPLLFSPAIVRFVSLSSGRSFSYGTTRPDIIRRSFGLDGTG